MALTTAAYPGGSASIVNKTNADKFIPEIWSDEVIAAYKKNLVLANLVNKMTMRGKKGDTLHIPKPTRGAASAKTVESTVTMQQMTGTGITINIDKHYEYSRLIEDLAEVQSLSSLRRFYTDDAGYALATQIDTDLLNNFANAQGGSGTAAWNRAVLGGDGSTLYVAASNNESAITDAGVS